MELVNLDHRICKVQKIPGDGNCLFGAIAHQLFHFDIHTVEHSTHTRALREMVVDCVRNNVDDERFIGLIRMRIRNEFRELDSSDHRQRAYNFLTVLNNDGIWGASESLLAIVMMFGCDITVYRENGFVTVVTDEGAVPVEHISVVYRGPIGRWNHYDSLIDFVDASPRVDNLSSSR